MANERNSESGEDAELIVSSKEEYEVADYFPDEALLDCSILSLNGRAVVMPALID